MMLCFFSAEIVIAQFFPDLANRVDLRETLDRSSVIDFEPHIVTTAENYGKASQCDVSAAVLVGTTHLNQAIISLADRRKRCVNH